MHCSLFGWSMAMGKMSRWWWWLILVVNLIESWINWVRFFFFLTRSQTGGHRPLVLRNRFGQGLLTFLLTTYAYSCYITRISGWDLWSSHSGWLQTINLTVINIVFWQTGSTFPQSPSLHSKLHYNQQVSSPGQGLVPYRRISYFNRMA